MEKLSPSKRNAIVGDYLSALSYGEIAAKQHVAIGTVANVVADLKAGIFPEAADVGEKIEELKELSVGLKQAKSTPGKCAVGLMVLTRINECGLEPADIERWPLILKSIKNADDAQDFVEKVYGIQEVQEKTGLTIDALYDKAQELEKKVNELEPASKKLAECKKQIGELTGQRKELASEVAVLEDKRKLLKPVTEDLEKREHSLLNKINEMEPKLEEAEATLSAWNKELKKLQGIGLTFEELAQFNQKVQAIAHRHSIKPAELRGRLVHELATLDKGLGLEALVKAKKLELSKTEQAVSEAKGELETVTAVVASFKQQKTNLEASIKATREKVSQEIAGLIPIARDAIAKLTSELHSGVGDALAGVSQLREQSLETGKEVGQYQGILESSAWLKDVLALARCEQDIEPKNVRAIALLVTRGLSSCLKVPDRYPYSSLCLPVTAENLIKELEVWRV